MSNLKMPAGNYYIGDLCYVMHNEWDEVCELLFAGRTDHGCNQGVFTLKDGRKFAIFNTAYGDGVYQDQYNRDYMVDSGSIGCFRVEDIEYNDQNNKALSHVFDFTQEFEVDTDGATLTFGHIIIDTDPPYDDYDEE